MLAPTTRVAEVLAALGEKTNGVGGEIKVRLRADRELPVDVVTTTMRQLRELQTRLNSRRGNDRKLNLTLLGEVREREK